MHMATSKSTVLIVEDDEESRDTLREVLELEGYKVQTAVNGQEALARLNTPDERICIMRDAYGPDQAAAR